MSHERNAYYAGRGNRFWQTLFNIGLTPKVLRPDEYGTVLQYGIGLTDLVKHKAGEDIDLVERDFDVRSFLIKMELHRPVSIAFNGKASAKRVLGNKSVKYGLQSKKISDATVFVLPSTSGAARRFWDSRIWHELAAHVQTTHA